MDHRFLIDVHDVPLHEGSWIFPIPRDWGVAAFEECEVEALEEPGELEVQVTRTGDDYLVQGRVRLTVAATCVRCLQPVPVEIDAPISVLYVPGPATERPAAGTDKAKAKGKEQDEEEEEPEPDDGPDVEHFQDHRLVLDAYVRDTILLEVPMNPKCAMECRLPERPRGAS